MLDMIIALQCELHKGGKEHSLRVAAEGWELVRWLVFGLEREPPQTRGKDPRSHERNLDKKPAFTELVALRLPPPEDDPEPLAEWRELSDVAQSALSCEDKPEPPDYCLVSICEARDLAFRVMALWRRYLTDIDCAGSWRHVPFSLNSIIRFRFASARAGIDRAPWTPLEALGAADFNRLGEDVEAQRTVGESLARVNADCVLLRTIGQSLLPQDGFQACEAEVRCEQMLQFLAFAEMARIARTDRAWRKTLGDLDSAGLSLWAPERATRPAARARC